MLAFFQENFARTHSTRLCNNWCIPEGYDKPNTWCFRYISISSFFPDSDAASDLWSFLRANLPRHQWLITPRRESCFPRKRQRTEPDDISWGLHFHESLLSERNCSGTIHSSSAYYFGDYAFSVCLQPPLSSSRVLAVFSSHPINPATMIYQEGAEGLASKNCCLENERETGLRSSFIGSRRPRISAHRPGPYSVAFIEWFVKRQGFDVKVMLVFVDICHPGKMSR